MSLHNHALDVGCSGYSWLDKIIEEQAAHYGLTPNQWEELKDTAIDYEGSEEYAIRNP